MNNINVNELNRQLELLDAVANELVNGSLTSANIAHDGKIKGYVIRNAVESIKGMINN